MRPIGRMRGFTLDVDDLEAGVDFWSRATGIDPVSPGCDAGCMLLHNPSDPRIPLLTLRRSAGPKDAEANHAHLDLTPRDHDVAIARVIELGGSQKTAPSIYPRPHSYPGESPLIEWVVMLDPFGNEFCLVRDLEPEERAALSSAAKQGDGDDEHWRSVAKQARTMRHDDDGWLPPAGFEGVGLLRNLAVDVEDIPGALHFWSAALGQPVIYSDWPGRYAYVGEEHEPDFWKCHLILHRIRGRTPDRPCRAHIDLDVADLDVAEAQLAYLSGGIIERVERDAAHAAGCPHAPARLRVVDPFGNECCFVLDDSTPEHHQPRLDERA